MNHASHTHNWFQQGMKSANISGQIVSWKMIWAEHVARMEIFRSIYNSSIRKHERKRSLDRPRSMWEDIIKMDLKEIGHRGVESVLLTTKRIRLWALVNTAVNQSKAIDQFLDQLSEY